MNASVTPAADYGAAPVSRSPLQMAMRRFVKNRRALACMGLLAIVGFATLLVPVFSPHDFREQDWDYVMKEPNGKYWFGTDSLGRDLMTRAFLGGRISFAVGFLATTVSVFIGVLYGATAAFLGGRTDALMMRFVDVLYGLPTMLIVIIVMAFLETRSILIIFVVLGMFGWMTMSRIVRGQVLSLREREFVEAARALGANPWQIIVRHMIPNVMGPVIIYSTLSVPTMILSESFLSFLGLGISEPETSWGVLISEGAAALGSEKSFWWLTSFPGVCLAITLFCLNSIGDGLRDAFDVQQR